MPCHLCEDTHTHTYIIRVEGINGAVLCLGSVETKGTRTSSSFHIVETLLLTGTVEKVLGPDQLRNPN